MLDLPHYSEAVELFPGSVNSEVDMVAILIPDGYCIVASFWLFGEICTPF